jgi:hypothetical protein
LIIWEKLEGEDMSKKKSKRKKAKKNQPRFNRRNVLGALGLAVIGSAGALWGLGFFSSNQAVAATLRVYKSPSCSCCNGWISHMRRNGFIVVVKNSFDLDRIKTANGITDDLESCHTAFVSKYVIEGHVPAMSIKRLLQERPKVKGLAVPGMPLGSPGMEGPDKEQYDVLAFRTSGAIEVFDRY